MTAVEDCQTSGSVADVDLSNPQGAIRGYLVLSLAALAAATLTASAYWPGLMSWDPVRQYGEALSGDIDDWHPPAMQWLWRQLIRIHPGPAPMLLLQLALYWSGLTVLAGTAWRQERRVFCDGREAAIARLGTVGNHAS